MKGPKLEDQYKTFFKGASGSPIYSHGFNITQFRDCIDPPIQKFENIIPIEEEVDDYSNQSAGRDKNYGIGNPQSVRQFRSLDVKVEHPNGSEADELDTSVIVRHENEANRKSARSNNRTEDMTIRELHNPESRLETEAKETVTDRRIKDHPISESLKYKSSNCDYYKDGCGSSSLPKGSIRLTSQCSAQTF